MCQWSLYAPRPLTHFQLVYRQVILTYIVDKETKNYIDEEIAKALNKVQVLTFKIQADLLKDQKQNNIIFEELTRQLKSINEQTTKIFRKIDNRLINLENN